MADKTLKWQPDLPSPASEDWRIAYGFKKGEGEKRFIYSASGAPAETSYQPPGGKPIPFIYDSVKLSGGLTVDTAEYPFFGLWSSTPLNEKPQGITVSGYFRGNEYIRNRNAMVEALRITTSDENPGYLNLTLWGRFPVIIIDWDISEKAAQGGQCQINLTFTRAGCPVADRWELKGLLDKTIPECAEKAKAAMCKSFDKSMAGKTDKDSLVSTFNYARKSLIDIVGRVQGTQKQLNDMTAKVTGISNLISQGIRSPKDLALALFAAAGKIVTSIAEMKNATEEVVSFFRIKNNAKNALYCFAAAYKYTLPIQAVTVKQSITKKETENIYKAMSLYALSGLLPELETQTYQSMTNHLALYTRLEQSLDLNDPSVYEAVNDLRMAVSRTLAAKKLSSELSINLPKGMPLLALAHYLGTEDHVLRSLNKIEDSFLIKGDIIYV